MRIRYFFITIILLLLPVFSWAEIITASTCSLTDVTNAYNAAMSGDTVIIPAGECSWSSRLTLSKAITLQGQGTSTKIINNYNSNGLIYISPSADLAIRVTRIYFYNATNNPGYTTILINGKKDGSLPLSKVRIDNNKIEMGTRCIDPEGWITGVIDSNQFVNCNIAIAGYGDGNYAWNRPIEAGTKDFLFIEDNLFTVNNSTPREPNEQIYHNSDGAKTVVRYNTFDYSSYTNGNAMPWEAHGNWGSISTYPSVRGTPIMEFYNNTITAYRSYRFMSHRGGSLLMHNNTFSQTSGSPASIDLKEEESWPNSTIFNMTPPVDTAWPAWDQVTNTFIWDNTVNGSPMIPYCYSSYDAVFIQQNRDYFLHAPQSSGGKSTYPTIPGKNDMTFSASGPNAYYPYTPFTYPHPLRGEEGINPPAGFKKL
ncbi:MAG: hypothetical protein AB1585_20925 [Thermodesulfobacteriota bacterium]